MEVEVESAACSLVAWMVVGVNPTEADADRGMAVGVSPAEEEADANPDVADGIIPAEADADPDVAIEMEVEAGGGVG
ncbi:hypothetical protein BBJ28_00004772 [Nothophytophthora sp. Chile5]|nr:hypothetical protein BBJ28_00004772 [Nothophytophthora sp. Chile5]